MLAKRALLATAFDRPSVAGVVLNRLGRATQEGAGAEIATAVQALHSGQSEKVAESLAKVSVDEVADFARQAVNAERGLLQEARTAASTRAEPIALLPSLDAAGDAPRPVVLVGSPVGTPVGMPALLAPAVIPQPPPAVVAPAGIPPPAVMTSAEAPAVLVGSPVGAGGELPDRTSPAPQKEPSSVALTRQAAARAQAIESLARAAHLDPLGRLHLERMEMTPVRYRRGDLMHSVTLLPGETVRLSHREWSRTEREFTSLVATSLENETDESVSEKSELTESTSAQQSHAMALSASMSASGTFGLVSIAANAGFSLSEQSNNAKQTSVRRSREMTRRAAARAKEEHKVTFRTMRAEEIEDTSFRELTNPSTDAIRWDFFRMMREWDVKVFRYGLRLTYDLTLPEPGSYLLRRYYELEQLEQRIDTPPTYPPLSGLTPATYAQWQERYDVALDPPPAPQQVGQVAVTAYPGSAKRTVGTIELAVPSGYVLDRDSFHTTTTEASIGIPDGASITEPQTLLNTSRMLDEEVTGPFSWEFFISWHGGMDNTFAHLRVEGLALPSPRTIEAWRAKAYRTLTEALKSRYEDETAQLVRRRDAIRRELAALDALSLRRLEREEIMKGVLRWVLGPQFELFPSELATTLHEDGPFPGASPTNGETSREVEYRGLYGPSGAVAGLPVWEGMLSHGKVASFIHQAIEWENVCYVLYPYFWAEPGRWDFKQRLQHADDAHWQFLRAGCARVVLTVRPGFESDWLRFADSGRLPESANPEQDKDYMTIADEIHEEARQYETPLTDPEHVEGESVLIGRWSEWTPTGALDVVRGEPLLP